MVAQDQHKAFDVLKRSWVLGGMTAYGPPLLLLDLFTWLHHSTIVFFWINESLSTGVKLHPGLPQGAPSSNALFLLAFEPFLSA